MKPEQVVDKMMSHDLFSQWLGIQILEVKLGYCRISMRVRKEMLNGFGIAHGGITYSIADSALAFASNSEGRKSVSIETSISHVISLKEGDEIIAIAELETETQKLGHYKVSISLASDLSKKVGLFKGMVYRTSSNWD